MKISKYIIISIIVSHIMISAYSKDINLTLNNGQDDPVQTVAIPMSPTSILSIDLNGDVTATTTADTETLGIILDLGSNGQPPEVLSLNQVLNGTSTSSNISWILADNDDVDSDSSVYCQKIGSNGASWPAPELILGNYLITSLSSSQNVSVNGDYSLKCFNSFGTHEKSVTVSGITTVINPIVTMSTSPNTILSGESSTLTWNISNTPTSCIKSGSWTGTMSASDITNGSHSLPLTNITSSKTYTLNCTNSAGGSGSISVSLTVTGSAACVDYPPVLSGPEDFTILANASSVGDTYTGQYDEFQQIQNPPPWPGNYGDTIQLTLTRNQYIAASFNSGTTNDHAKFLLETPTNFEGPIPTAVTVAISSCPGDFTEKVGGQSRCTAVGGAIPNLFWSTDPNANPALFCILEKDTQYYLNIIHSNSTDNGYTTSGCGASYCGVLGGQTTVDL